MKKLENQHFRYFELVEEAPEAFHNPGGALYEIILDKQAILDYEEKTGTQIGVVFEDSFFIMVRDLVRDVKGNIFGYDRLFEPNSKSSAVILPITNTGEVVLLKQFRHATRAFSYEIPRGFGKLGLSSTENAKDELGEELGCSVIDLRKLGAIHSNTGLSGVKVDTYLAVVTDLEGAPFGYEGIAKYFIVPIPEIKELIRNGQITDGFTLSALAMYL